MKRKAFIGLVAAFLVLTIVSCNKTETSNPALDKAEATTSSTTNTCATYTVDLIAAQNITVGTVTVENDAESLFVTYATTDGWMIECNHLYVGSLENVPTTTTGNPQTGLFPLRQCFDPMVNTTTYEIPLNSLDNCFIVAAQAEVSQIVDGVIVSSQAAWGAGTAFDGNAKWATYFDYCPTACETATGTESTEETCYEEAIAWADGEPYGSGTNCGCTYVVYSPGITASIIASQTLNAGEVSFSAITDGMVTITISLAEGWELQDVLYSVKIEGYDTAPTEGARAHDFSTYKGNELTVTVPAFNYYGVHLNLQHVVPCE